MPATNELLQEGRYRIDQPAEGTDNVFEAYDTVRKTTVIVREIPVKMNKVMTVSQQESLKVAFSTQAKTLTEIKHDALTPVHDFFSEIDRQYLVMEAIQGDTLATLLSRQKRPFSVDEITSWADQLLDALHYLHSQRPSIIHRNIRPQNLKLNAGKVKLFGVCPDSGDSDSTEDLRYSPMELIWPGLDAASQKVITNSYDDRSERILKEPADARSDIYSLGATLYFLATGCEPVDPLERSIDILEGKLDPLREPTSVNENIAPEISDVLMKALEIKRENRYDSAAIMRQVLQSAVARVMEKRQDADIHRTTQPQSQPQPARPVVQQVSQPVVETPRVEAPPAPQPPPPTFVEPKVSNDVMAYRQNDAVDENELAAVLRELEEAESKTAEEATPPPAPPIERFEQSVIDHGTVDAPPEVKAEEFEPVVHHAPAPEPEPEPEPEVEVEVEAAPAAVHTTDEPSFDHALDAEPTRHDTTVDFDDDDIFSASQKSGFSLPLPAVAGAVVLVLVIAVGGWFVMSKSPETPKPEPVQTETAQQPAPVEQPPVEQQVATTDQTGTVASATDTTQTQEQPGAVKASASPKAKKAEPAKTDKKKVTVDDLINDN